MKRKFEILCGRREVHQVEGYLYYDTDTKQFSMQLARRCFKGFSIFFQILYKRGIKDVPQHLVDRWVDNRIIPPDRQGLYDILKEMGITEYDRFTMLLYNNGICQMDSSYIREVEN